MKSRITIEIDFNNGNEPVIQILSRPSDDVRDNLIKAFYQKLGSSSWCKVVFNENIQKDEKRITIIPIPDSELEKESKVIVEQVKLNSEWAEQNA